jgi:hypothetical protein
VRTQQVPEHLREHCHSCCRCQFLVRAFGIKVRKCGKQELYRGGACMYLVSSS